MTFEAMRRPCLGDLRAQTQGVGALRHAGGKLRAALAEVPRHRGFALDSQELRLLMDHR